MRELTVTANKARDFPRLSYLIVRITPLKEIYDLNAWNRLKSVQRKRYSDIFAVKRGVDFTVYISRLHFNG